jgi:hypothetical protein
MRPVRKNGNHRVLSCAKPLEQEFGLTPPKVQDAGDSRRDGVTQRRVIAVDEQVMVCCALSLIGGRSDLDATRGEKDSDLRTGHQGSVSGLDDLDACRLLDAAAGKRR